MTLTIMASTGIGAALFFAISFVFSQSTAREGRLARLQSITGAATAQFSGATASALRRTSRLDRQLSGNPFGAWLKRDLRRSGLAWQLRDYVGIVVVTGLVCGALGWTLAGFSGAAGGIVAGAGIPMFAVKRIGAKRAAKLNGQIVDLVELLASSLRAGFTFIQSMELASREQADPLAGELKQTVRETSLGISTDEALERLAQRTGDADLALVITAVLVQRRAGGNLGEVLLSISGMIRERIRVRGQIKAMTAQARMSSWIVGLLPVVVAIAMSALQPGYLDPLFSQLIGRMALVSAVVMEVLGFAIIRRIGKIDF